LNVGYSKKLGPPIVAAAFATIAMTYYAIVMIVRSIASTEPAVFHAVWPIALTSGLAVLFVMSFLYSSLSSLVRELEKKEEIARHDAIHDPLTGLGNRRLLEDRLKQALAHVRRGDLKVAVLMLDLDRFKQVNDTLGHGAGDALVKEVGVRLTALLRETDTVTRVGGDEFVIIQSGPRNAADVRRLCERIIEAIGKPFPLPERAAHVGVSIGAVMADSTAVDAADLIRKADVTMYRAKAAGRNCFRMYSEAIDEALQRRDRVEIALRKALDEKLSLDLHYQPLLNSRGEIVGLEALLRWDDPVVGPVGAAEAVAIAEDCGLMHKLTLFTFERACKAAQRWPKLTIAVNISPAVFRQPGFAAVLGKVAARAGVPCEQFELEIIETLLIEHSETAVATLKQFRSMGFRIALDDFGTGYSSLSYLRRFAVDKVKLDRSFMQDVGSIPGDAKNVIAIVKGAVALGHALGSMSGLPWLPAATDCKAISTPPRSRPTRSIGC
jgi:diguanylate cyclase (GGDEF)-like protein